MTDITAIWNGIIDDFAKKSSKERLRFFANSPKRQHELFRETLHVPAYWRENCIHKCGSAEGEKIHAALLKCGDCFGMSLFDEVDEQVVSFEEAFKIVHKECSETIIYSPSKHIAYFEGGHCDRGYLKRT